MVEKWICSELHPTILNFYFRIPCKVWFPNSCWLGYLYGHPKDLSLQMPMPTIRLLFSSLLFMNLTSSFQKLLTPALLSDYVSDSKWEMRQASNEKRHKDIWGKRQDLVLKELWEKGKWKYRKGEGWRKRKSKKGEINRMKVKNRSETQMRMGKALEKAKRRKCGV